MRCGGSARATCRSASRSASPGSEGVELGDLLEQASIPAVDDELIHEAGVERVRLALDELEERSVR